MTTEEDFQRQLDAQPDDHNTRLVFADWLQEHDDPRAEGYRALGMLRKFPFMSDSYPYRWHSKIEDEGDNTLPKDWWFNSVVDKNKQYPMFTDNRQRADDLAALAFTKLPQHRRAELLGQQSQEKLSRRRLSRRRYNT